MKFVVALVLFLSGTLAGPVERRQLTSGGSHCDRFCTEQYSPVCGSDGKTYSNMCFLTIMACHYQEKGLTLSVSHLGACGGSQVGQMDQTACSSICDEERKPLCASDGNVYDNLCLFQRAECEAAQNNTRLVIIQYGDTCPTPTAPECSKYQLDTSNIAVEGGVQITPTCPHTTDPSARLCASDGQTYSSECQLCHTMELKNADLKIVYSGSCHHYSSSGSLLGSSGSGHTSLQDLLNQLTHHQGGTDPLVG